MTLGLSLIFSASVALAQNAEPRYEQIVALENAAAKAQAKGQPDDAISAHSQAIELARALKRPRLAAVLLDRLGITLQADNRVQDAVHAYEAGFRSLAQDPALELESVLRNLIRVGKGFSPAPRSTPADIYSAETDQELARAETNATLAVTLLIHIGNGYMSQPQDGPALNAYTQALERPEIEQAPLLKAYALANSGEILRRGGNAAAAERALIQARDLLERYAEPLEKRRVLALLAGLHRDRGDRAAALRLYAEALSLYARSNDTRGYGRACAGVGQLQLESGDLAAARQSFEHALDLSQKADDHDSLWFVYLGLGQCRHRLGDLNGAAEAFAHSVEFINARTHDLRTDEGKVAFLETTADVIDEWIAVHLELARTAPSHFAQALAIAENARGLALNEIMGGWGRYSRPGERALGLAPCEPPPANAANQGLDRRMRTFRNSPVQMAPGVELDLQDEPLSFANAAAIPRQFQAPNAAAYPDAASPLNKSGTKGSHKSQPAQVPPAPVARLVFHVMADATAAFMVATDGTVTGHRAAIKRVDLERAVADLRLALNVDHAARGVVRASAAAGPAADRAMSPEALLANLYAVLVKPLEGALPDHNNLLAIEPHGPLWLVPFAALQTSDGRCLGERAALLYSPSQTLLDQVRNEDPYRSPSEAHALIIGNPVVQPVSPADDDRFRIGFLPLPGADREADALSELFQKATCSVLHGTNADLATVVRQAPKFSILHLATHGLASAEEPLDSFVLLAPSVCGDRLSARRVLTLPLAADLVALSACQSGLGRISGDGMIGLSRAFLIAGARSILVSQWSIDDDATLQIMRRFYRLYLQNGMDKARALQKAMLELRANERYANPRYWAAFTLVGSER